MGLLTTMSAASDVKTGDDADARAFIAEHEKAIRPLERAAAPTWWNANITGKDEDFDAKEETQNRLDAALADRERFAELKALKESPSRDPIVVAPDRRALSDLPGKAGRSRAPAEDDGQGQRRREGVQRLPRQGRRQGDDRQRGPQGPQGIDGLGPAARRSGRRARRSAPSSRPT